MSKIKYIFYITILATLFSCQQDDEDIRVLNSIDFGKAGYYKPFWFCKKEILPLEKTLVFEFNEEAKKENSFVELTLTDRNTGKAVGKELVSMLVNGTVAPDNKINVTPSQLDATNELKLGFLFNENAGSGNYQWLMKVTDSSLDRIDEVHLETQATPAVFLISSAFSKRMNPLLLGIYTSLAVIVGLLLLWILVMRPVKYPRFNIAAITVFEPYYEMYKPKSYYKIIFTNRAEKQSFFQKLFKGKILYAVNEVWTEKWELIPKNKNTVKPLLNRNILVEPFSPYLSKQVDYTVTINTTGQKIKIRIH